MKWVTRERVKVDRVACPWLIRKFIDPAAEFLFVPAEQVMSVAKLEGAIPYDVPGVEFGHHGKECSFDALVRRHGLEKDSALVLLARIVNGADTDNSLWNQAESAGLNAVAEGFRHLGYGDDMALNRAEWIIYDALYAYCQEMMRRGKPEGAFAGAGMQMLAGLLDIHSLEGLSRDARLLFAARFVRLFAYGFLSVVLLFYLKAVGMSDAGAGLLLTLALFGDTAISLWLTTSADRFGRRKTLLTGAGLMLLAGVTFALTGNFWLLLFAAIVGVISPSGNEVGPFLAVEQAALTQLVQPVKRTGALAWYNLTGSVATALGSLSAGGLMGLLDAGGVVPVMRYRVVIAGYALLGLVLAGLFLGLSRATEVEAPATKRPALFLGLHKSKGTVFKLSSLFCLDAFAGGFVMQAVVAYWFFVRFSASESVIGGIFFGANILAGISALAASRLAKRFGLVNTMVWTHIPSNVLLILVPLMPNLPLAIAVLLARFSISQMDVPTRQSYTLAVVDPDERSAATGVTGVARTTGAAMSPGLAQLCMGTAGWLSVPFYVAGGLKILYDMLLYRSFVKLLPPEEHAAGREALQKGVKP